MGRGALAQSMRRLHSEGDRRPRLSNNSQVNRAQPLSTHVSPIDPRAARRGRAWHNAPLRAKVIALGAAALIGGCAAGIVAAMHPLGVWALLIVISSVLAGLLWFGKRYVWGPYEKLVDTLHRISESDLPAAIDALTLTRRDELGAIARSLHQLTSWAQRDHREARLIRKTLDRRIEEATRHTTHQLRRMAMRDALTDLGNRYFLDDNLEPLTRSVRESDDDLVCMVFDVDNFKQINDTLGHAAGDEILILLGSLIRATARKSDIAVRLGGDEFVILLPGCSGERAKLLAHRISSLFTQHVHTTVRTQVPVSLSIGIASLQRDEARSGHELLEIADRKLYQAKRAGKGHAVGA